MSTISVLIADDQHLVRAGFRSLLRRGRDIAVVGEASTGDEAVRAARELRPDVILMDIRMPGLDGIAATRGILAELPTRVIILTTFETDEYVFAALAAGASGFLTKEVSPEGLREAVRVVPGRPRRLRRRVSRRRGGPGPGVYPRAWPGPGRPGWCGPRRPGRGRGAAGRASPRPTGRGRRAGAAPCGS